MKKVYQHSARFFIAGLALVLLAPQAKADQVISDDLVVVGNGCIGLDCFNDQVFATGPLELSENNTRMTFGRNGEFRLAANSSANGGLNEFRIDSFQGPMNVSGLSGLVPNAVSVNEPTAVVLPDGSLQIPLDGNLLLASSAVNVPSNLIDGQFVFAAGQTAIIPAGQWSSTGVDTYSILADTVFSSTAASGFEGEVTNGAERFVAFSEDGNMVVLGVGSEYVVGAVSVGSAAAQRQVQGVADAVAASDLINFGQLQSALVPVMSFDLDSSIHSEASRLDGVSAMTAAMSALQPNPRAQAPMSLSLGVGTYEGETAAAVGLLMRLSQGSHFQFGLAGSNESAPLSSMSLRIVW